MDAGARPEQDIRRRWLGQGLDWLIETSAVLATIGLGAIVIMYSIEIFSRYFLNAPTTWANDFIVFTLCASIFLMMPEITRSGGHVAVTLFTDLLPEAARNTARRLLVFTGFGVCAFAAWISLEANLNQYINDLQTVTTIQAPKWMITMFVTYGLAVSALEFLRQAMSTAPPGSATAIG
jgi:C4-dicarboxylate transporter, DctQ subunit